MDEVAQHIVAANLEPPKPHQQVFKDDCSYCFDTPDSPYGLDVCLHCFSSSSPDPSHDYTDYHKELTGHTIYLNIKRTPKETPRREESPKKVQKLAIEADREEDHYDTTTAVKDLQFPGVEVDRTIANLPAVIDGVLTAKSYAKKEEIQAWELELNTCNHVQEVVQFEVKGSELSLDCCSGCGLKENLWFCLVCANLGCGRAQFGGVGGNSHALDHFKATGHSCSVKLGSITPEGNADIYCYPCDTEVLDPEIGPHLKHWGINIEDRIQTEKSLTEMNLEQNLKWDFSMTTEDGKTLSPLFGPGITGLRNLGNSCYMSSVLQCLFSLPQFQLRYSSHFEPTTREPANDLEVQMRKLADGLLSGRYAVPANDTEGEIQHQKGLSPGMFKALIGRGHSEFSTMRQQDAFEFFIHLLDKISQDSRKRGFEDPAKSFQFDTEQRIECKSCHKVRYKSDHQENLSIPVPARKTGDNEYETIQLKECLDLYVEPTDVDFKCNCGHTGATTETKFKSFPDVLLLNCRRFQIINWVPTKLDIPVEVSDQVFEMDQYVSAGKQENEIEMSDDEPEEKLFQPNDTALGQLEQMGMPKVRAEKALYATGNSDTEAAMNWLLEHMDDPDIDVPITLYEKKAGASNDEQDPEKVAMLASMGFTEDQAKVALVKNDGNIEIAAAWLFENPDASAEDVPPPPQDEGPRGDPSLPAKYQLKGIICHKGGSIHAGHYVAFVRKEIEGQDQWVLFNDEKVVQGGEADEMKKFAYVYMFERVR